MQATGEKITVRVPVVLKAAIRQEAKDKGVSMGVITRWALQRYFQQQAEKAGVRVQIEEG